MIIPRIAAVCCAVLLVSAVPLAPAEEGRLTSVSAQPDASVDDALALQYVGEEAWGSATPVSQEVAGAEASPPVAPAVGQAVAPRADVPAKSTSNIPQKTPASASKPAGSRTVKKAPASLPPASPRPAEPAPNSAPSDAPNPPLTVWNTGASTSLRVPLSAAEQAAADARDATFAANYQASLDRAAGVTSGAPLMANGRVLEYYPNQKVLEPMIQFPQETSYWCGPAVYKSMLAGRGIGITQAAAAATLKTKLPAGTELWDMVGPLGATLGRGYSVQWVGPMQKPGYVATPADKELYRKRLVGNIGMGYPMTVIIVEPAGKPRLPGHPSGFAISHFVGIRGYNNYGVTTHYLDPAAKSAHVGWPAVRPYGDVASDFLVSIAAGEGYLW